MSGHTTLVNSFFSGWFVVLQKERHKRETCDIPVPTARDGEARFVSHICTFTLQKVEKQSRPSRIAVRQHGRGASTGLAHTVGGGATVDTLRYACTGVNVHRLVYLHARYFCDPRCCIVVRRCSLNEIQGDWRLQCFQPLVPVSLL